MGNAGANGGDISEFVSELNAALQTAGYSGVVNALRSIQANSIESVRDKRISDILLTCSIEFGFNLKELLSKSSFKGEKAICVKTMTYLLYRRENLSLSQIANILPVQSESAVSKQKSYIESLDKNIPYHRELIGRIEKITRILDKKQNNDSEGN